jgi:hypothetical protein
MMARDKFYVLNADGDPWPVDVLTWAQWFEDGDRRRIALDTFPDGRLISTVFLGLDHNWGDGPPLLFETMVFLGGNATACYRYATRPEALAHHARLVAAAEPGAAR